MREEGAFAVQTLLVTVILNGLLLAVVYWMAGATLQTQGQLLVFVALGVAITLILWLVTVILGRRLAHSLDTARQDAEMRRHSTLPEETAPARPVTQPAAPKAPSAEQVAKSARKAAAVQMLSLLQEEGRLVDFLQENLSQYEDAQIGAAVRGIHEGCNKVLATYVTLEPIYSESEGSQVTIRTGFDANEVRLSGNVVGDPPFTGTLRHRGWRATQVDLPERTQEKNLVVTPAEVEVGV